MKKLIILLSMFFIPLYSVDTFYIEGVKVFDSGNESLAIELFKKSYRGGNQESRKALFELHLLNSNTGYDAYLKHKYEKAIFYYDMAEYIMDIIFEEEIKYREMSLYAFSLKMYAMALDDSGDEKEAMNKFNKALDISKKYSTNKNIEAGIFLEITNTLSHQLRYTEAKKLYADLDIDAITDPFWKASALMSYAGLLLETGNMDKAIVYFEKSLKICKKNFQSDKKAYTKNIAVIYHSIGKSIAKREIVKKNLDKKIDKEVLRKALVYYNNSLDYVVKMPLDRIRYGIECNNYLDKAIAYGNMDNLKENEIYLKKYQKLFEKYPTWKTTLAHNSLYYNFSLLYFRLNKINLASQSLEKLTDVFKFNSYLYHKLKADIACKKIGCTK